MAAEQGYADAQFSLGLMYDSGQGVAQNYVEAAKWYRRAAEQGEAAARNNLGIMYACQRRLEFPQKCRSKFPQFCGPVIGRFSDRLSRFWAGVRGVWEPSAV